MARALLLVSTFASLAQAQPSAMPYAPPPLPPAPPPLVNAVEVGASFGGTTAGDLYTGLELGGSHRLSPLVWIHVAVETATTPNLSNGFSRPVTSDRFSELRGGLEVRPCASFDRVCGLVGVDVGYRHELFDTTMNRSGGEAVFRLGGDLGLGTRNVRLRAMFEGTSTHVADTSAVTATLVYLW
jgi:hypothetical protein